MIAVVALVIGCEDSATATAALPPSPAPHSSAAVDRCRLAIPHPDLQSAFAYEIKSAPVLRFLSQIKRVPERDQPHIFDGAVAAATTPGQHKLEVAEYRECPTIEAFYAQRRALALVANEWSPSAIEDNDRFIAFSRVVGDAIIALELGGKLTDEQHQAALLPFADLTAIPQGSDRTDPGATRVSSLRRRFMPSRHELRSSPPLRGRTGS